MPPRNRRALVDLAYIELLRPGDILLFRASQQPYFIQKLIMGVQALFNFEHGHYDTTHAAICAGHTPEGQPLIAHITEVGNITGYKLEALQDMLAAEPGQDRSFLIFRAKDQATAKVAADLASQFEIHQDVRWSLKTALSTIITYPFSNSKKCNEDNPFISKSTICSQFVIELFHAALAVRSSHGEATTQQLQITPISTPKALEKCLYDDQEHYDMLCYAGKNAYKNFCTELETQLNRIAQRTDQASQDKYIEGWKIYQETTQQLATTCFDELKKIRVLLQKIQATLDKNTGYMAVQTTSTRVIKTFVRRRMCIFERDLAESPTAITSPVPDDRQVDKTKKLH